MNNDTRSVDSWSLGFSDIDLSYVPRHIKYCGKEDNVMLGLVVLIISLLIIIDIIIVISREQNLTDIVLIVSTNHGPELPLMQGKAS